MSAGAAVGGASGLEVLRRSLWPFAPLYGFVAGVRNRMFDAGWFEVSRLDVPVVSVGNLTVGGTGKTPLVCWLVEQARAAGLRPGVLARGYGRAEGAELNDEGMLLRRRFPDLLQVQDPVRSRGGRQLVERGADWIVLDDGFQHRRLHRDLDIVCVDAAKPFGRGGMLPSGDLREPARPGLRRVGMVVITRADAVGSDRLDALRTRLRGMLADGVRVFAATHSPTRFAALGRPSAAQPLTAWRGRRVVAVAAIARPESFEATLTGLGCEVVARRWFLDHHRFSADDAAEIVALGQRHDAAVVVTEKDAVKLAELAPETTSAITVLEIDLRFLGPAPGFGSGGAGGLGPGPGKPL